MDDAVIITGAESHYESVMAEYEYIQKIYSKNGLKFTIENQEVLKNKKKHYDAIKVRLSDGVVKTIFFDISESYDKFVIYPQ